VTASRYPAEAAEQSEGEHAGNVRTAAYWLRKAIRARVSANTYPEDRDALESLAEMYEMMAEQVADLGNR
jgi:hypothetical protein